MSVSLLTVWRAARARAVPFTGESAGYLVFLACEELALAPRSVSLSSIGLEEDGSVRLQGREASDDGRAERELRALLAQLLEVASSPGIALVRAAGRPASGSVSTFSAELSKALIPFNRSAARRALGRLHRETARALESAALAAEPASAKPATVLSAPTPAPIGVTSAAVPMDATTPTPLAPIAIATVPAPPPAAFVESLLLTVDEPAESPMAPPEVELRAPAEEVTPMVTRELVEHPTRPETLAARRARELPSLPEWTEPLPTPLRRGPSVLQSTADPAIRPIAEVPVATVGFDLVCPETPLLGSLVDVFEVMPSREPLAFELAYDDATERVPQVFTPESALLETDHLEWPVELADQGKAIPLEPERDALPRAPEPEPYAGMAGEKSDVRKLLSGFHVAAALPENDLRSELKRLAGIDETPIPTQSRRR